MKACPKCQTQNNDNARFCIQCREYLKPEPRKCPNGHVMDSTWTECNICKNQAQPAGVTPERRTVAEGATPPPKPVVPPSPAPPPGPPSPAAKQRRVTRYAAPGSEPGSNPGISPAAPPPQARGGGRRIVGILITYTWKQEGQLFPVREGRNLIGRDPDQCEIAIPEDTTLSSTNTHITFRKNFVIGDMVSMSGTDVDGEPIEEQFRSLHNYATIRTGSTYWTFISAQPDEED